MESDDSYYKNDNQDVGENGEENSEEKMIQGELENMELSKVLQIQSKFNLKEKFKNVIQNGFKPKNPEKKGIKVEGIKTDNNAPKEFSAKIKPIRRKKDFKKAIRRDPRFDDLSGKLNQERFDKNFTFVKDIASDYLNKVSLLKKKRKYKINETDFEFIKKQDNFVKGWIKKKEYEETKNNIKKEINKENLDRESKGKKKIFLKKKMLNELLRSSQDEKRKKEDYKKYIKKENHKKMKKIRIEEKLNK